MKSGPHCRTIVLSCFRIHCNTGKMGTNVLSNSIIIARFSFPTHPTKEGDGARPAGTTAQTPARPDMAATQAASQLDFAGRYWT